MLEKLAEQGEDYPERLEDLRAFLADGWTYTHSDFRDLAGAEAMANVDKGRDYLKQARTYRWVVWVLLVLLLVVIGFLGGRGWLGRVKYAASFLLVSSGIIFLIFGPGYGALAKSGPVSQIPHLRLLGWLLWAYSRCGVSTGVLIGLCAASLRGLATVSHQLWSLSG